MNTLYNHLKTLKRRRDWLSANGENSFAIAERAALNYVIDNCFGALGAEQDSNDHEPTTER